MKQNLKTLTFEDLYEQIFTDKITNKQNKDRLYKLAKTKNDIKTIKRMANELDFKSAKVYLQKKEKLSIEDAINTKDFSAFKTFVDNGADISKIKVADLIDQRYDDEFIKFFIEKNFHVNIAQLTKKNYTVETIKFAIDKGANPNLKFGLNGETALLIALDNKSFEIVKFLLEKVENIDVNIPSDYYTTALMKASYSNNSEIVNLLLKKKDIKLDVQDYDGFTALMAAVEKNNFEIVQLLISKGANTNICNKKNGNALDFAFKNLDYRMIKLLLDNGTNYNEKYSKQSDGSITSEEFEARKNFALKVPLLAKQLEEKIISKNDAEQFILFSFKMISTSFSQDEIYALMNNTKQPKKELERFVQIHKVSLEQIDEIELKEEDNAIQVYNAFMTIINSIEAKAKIYTLTSILEIIMQIYSIGVYSNIYDDEISNKDKNSYKFKLVLENQFDGKAFIHVYNDSLIFHFLNKNAERFSSEYKKLTENKFHSNKHGDILLVNNYIIERTPTGLIRVSRFIMMDEFDSIINSINHNPRLLTNTLKKFSGEKLKYTNHDWDDLGLTYKTFVKNMERGWAEIKDKLKVLLNEKTYQDIERFLFEENLGEKDSNGNVICWGENILYGWSSSEIKKSGNKPHQYPIVDDDRFTSFKDIMDRFKGLFVIKQSSKATKMLKKFTKLRKENSYDFKLDLEQLKTASVDNIYTDVNRLESALSTILSEMNDRVEANKNTVEVSIEQDNVDNNTIVLKIVHFGSTSDSSIGELSKATESKDGGFKSIYNNLISVCDWSVVTYCNQEKKYFEIEYLKQEDKEVKNYHEIPSQVKGFTHILRFYI